MKFLLKILIILSIVITYNSCNDDSDVKRSFTRVTSINAKDINSSGATLRGSLEIGTQPVLSVGFVWSQVENPLLESAEFVEIDFVNVESNTFEFRVSTTLSENENYYFRAFAKEEGQTIYGTELILKSLGSGAPTITDFSPKTVVYRDTVVITGKNFSNKLSTNTVQIGSFQSTVLFANDTLLKVLVPQQKLLLQSELSVSISGNKSTANDLISLIPLEINELQSSFAKSYDTLSLSGTFGILVPYSSVKFNNTIGKITEVKRDRIKVVVPPGLENPVNISITVGSQQVATSAFTYLKPKILSIPTIGTWLEEITILGENFQTGINSSKVFMTKSSFPNVECEIISQSDSEIKFLIPESLTRTPSSKVILKDASHDIQINFTMREPIIESILPSSVTFGDEIIIRGQNFHPSNNFLNVNATNSTNVTASTYSQEEIRFNIPNSIQTSTGTLNVRIGPGDGTYIINEYNVLTQLPPQINDFNPKTVHNIGDQITIIGSGFSPLITNNTVKFNGKTMTIVSATNNQIVAAINSGNIPDQLVTSITQGNIEVTSGNQSGIADSPLILDYEGKWTQIMNAPADINSTFSEQVHFDGQLFFLGGEKIGNWNTNLWKYTEQQDNWSTLGPLPGGERSRAFFVKNPDGFYYGLGDNSTSQLWDLNFYNLELNNWTNVVLPPEQAIVGFYAGFYLTKLNYITNGNVYSLDQENWSLDYSISYPSPHVSNGGIIERKSFLDGNIPYLIVADQSYNDIRKAYLKFYRFENNIWNEDGSLDKDYNWGQGFDLCFYGTNYIINTLYDPYFLKLSDFSLQKIDKPNQLINKKISFSVEGNMGVYFMFEDGTFWRLVP